jgi:hypothetical protein
MMLIRLWKWVSVLSLLLFPAFMPFDHNTPVTDQFVPNTGNQVNGSDQGDRTQQRSSSWQMIGQIGGRTEDVAVQGQYAYVAVGLRLVVLDVSDPSAPREIGSTTPFPQFVEGVSVSGGQAYVATGMTGLHVVDISDPTSPVEVGFYDTPGYAEGVVVTGHYAYVADGHYGLRIVNVSDPTHPAEVAYAYPLNYIFDVVVDGQYAYLAAAGAGMLIADVSKPARPIELGSWDTPGYAYGVAVAEDVVYVADGWESLRVVNVGDRAHPVEVSSYDTPGWAFGVDVVGSTLYVADAFAGLQVLDVSDPTHPSELGGYEVSGGHAGSVFVVGNTAYVADRNWGLRIVDVSDPGVPAQVGFYGPLGYAVAVEISGDYAFVGATIQGLRVVDISDPTHPVEVGAYDTQSYPMGVAVDGNYAYVVTMFPEVGAGLHVVDVSDPAHPTRVGYLNQMEGAGRDIVVASGIAYIPDEFGLRLIDVSQPSTPTVRGYIDLQGEELGATSGVAVSGTLAYVAQDEGGLRIVDISNPASPTLMSTFWGSQWVKVYDIDVAGNTAYMTHHGGEGLMILDVSDPINPTQVGAFGGPGLPERVSVVDSTAYVAFGNGGMYAIDISNPSSPTLVELYDTLGYATAAILPGGHLYVADGQGGLLVLEMGPEEARTTKPIRNKPTFTSAAWSNAGSSRPLSGYPAWTSLSLDDTNGIRGEAQALPRQLPGARPGSDGHRIAGACVVTSTNDSGPGTLRECMENATNGDTITFDTTVFPPSNPTTIALQTELPQINSGNLTIDASNAGVILDGNQMLGGAGLNVQSSNNTISGLQIVRFSHTGINLVEGSNNNLIGGDRTIGSGPLGQGNLVSGSGMGGGIFVGGNNNIVIGNLIGTDVSGLWEYGGSEGVFNHGIFIQGGSDNRIGGTSPGERNLISANGGSGIAMQFAAGNVVVGNYIGTDINGTYDLGNKGTGVEILMGSAHNVVKDNLISGSNWGGVVIGDLGSDYNTVIGNLIGTDATGTQAIGNRWTGVGVGETFNRIGGTSTGEGNVISGNPQGVSLQGNHNLILGNFIGTSNSGTHSISNGQGVVMTGNTSQNFVGGTTDAERNLISGNASVGISLDGPERIFILGNYVGTDASGTVTLGNGASGVETGSAKYTLIQGNLIVGNKEMGVSIGPGSDFSHLRTNRIGVATDGASPLPNGTSGVLSWSASNTIGGSYPEDGNVIAFNNSNGVQVWTYPGNTIRRNSIYSNSGAGIYLTNGGNDLLPAPVITAVTSTSVSGTACSGCIVEVFSDKEDEGRVYEGYIIANGNGNWTWTGSPSGPWITTTATDEKGNTSAFSTPQILDLNLVYLPLIMDRGD